jgi:Arc/MetJ-type ribon-helix-helix transcriptional regulator
VVDFGKGQPLPADPWYDEIYYREVKMPKGKIAITLDERFIGELDRLVEKRVFQSRSQAIQEAVGEKLLRMKRTRLSEESAKLEPSSERAVSEEGLAEDTRQWPEY